MLPQIQNKEQTAKDWVDVDYKVKDMAISTGLLQ